MMLDVPVSRAPPQGSCAIRPEWPDRFAIMVIAVLACVCAGLLSVALGPDNNWDLRFYHLYAPWAYLHDRYLFDIGPAQYQGFFNPTADFLFYGLVSSPLNDSPRLVAFIMGAVHGINVALIFGIACHVLRPALATERWIVRISALVMGCSGAGFISLLGTTTNDLLNSIFVLGALLGLLKVAEPEGSQAVVASFAWPGLLAGIGFGLKYTAVVFVPALALVAITAAIKRRTASGLSAFCAAGLLGFLAAAGHHLLTLWHLFGNPLFPLFNDIFKSPFYEPTPLRDGQFLTDSFWDAIALPFYWTQTNSDLVSELPFRDWRVAIAYVAIVACTIQFIIYRAFTRRESEAAGETRGLGLVNLFVVVSFVFWVLGFCIYRYAVTLEMLTGVTAMGTLIRLLENPRLRIASALLIVMLAGATTIYIDWGRGEHPSAGIRPARYGQRYIDVSVPHLPANSVVLIATWDPASYFIPFAEPSIQFVGIENNFLTLSQGNRLVSAVKQLMVASGRPKFIVSLGEFDRAKLNGILESFDLILSSSPCLPIRSNLEEQPLSICPTMPRQ